MITIFPCKYCLWAYGENELLTDMSKATIISDIIPANTNDQRVELKGKRTFSVTFSIEEIKIGVAQPNLELQNTESIIWARRDRVSTSYLAS